MEFGGGLRPALSHEAWLDFLVARARKSHADAVLPMNFSGRSRSARCIINGARPRFASALEKRHEKGNRRAGRAAHGDDRTRGMAGFRFRRLAFKKYEFASGLRGSEAETRLAGLTGLLGSATGARLSGFSTCPIITLNSGTCRNRSTTTPCFSDVSFFVDQGETAVIMGRSGVGKSVSLKLLLGFLQPDEGQIIVAGRRRDQLHRSAVRRDSPARDHGFSVRRAV